MLAFVTNLLGPLFGKLLDWFPSIAAYFAGRSAGKAAMVAEAQQEVNETRAAEDNARAEAPSTVPGVIEDLTKGIY